MTNILQHAILWRRLDLPGHDACALSSFAAGWRLAGTAVFVEDTQPCRLGYEVTCDAGWRTLAARVRGWIGRRPVRLDIEALSGHRWSLDGQPVQGLDGLVDVDLGFTPATNLLQLRRLALGIGEGADAPVVYLHFPELELGRLEQRYERTTADTYDYRAPRFGYAASLEMGPAGFVTRYPGLWEAEALE